MGAVAIPQSSLSPHSTYVEELQELFASTGLPCGSPADIVAIVQRMQEPGAFPDELRFIVRSIILREGGFMPHAQLMEILALAIGGPEIERAPQQYQQSLRQLLTFVTGVLHQPVELPPGHRSTVVPFPREDSAAVREDPIVPAPELRPTQPLEPDPAGVAHNFPGISGEAMGAFAEPEIEPATATEPAPAAAPPPPSILLPRLTLAAYLPRRLSPSALRSVLLASVSLILLAESLFLFLHRDVLIPVRYAGPAASPKPAPRALAATTAAPESVPAPPAPTAPAVAHPAKPSAYGEAFVPQLAGPASRPRTRADGSDSDDVAPPRVLQAYVKPGPPTASNGPAVPQPAAPANPPGIAAETPPAPAAAPIVRQPPPAESASAFESRRNPDDFVAGDPRPVRPEPSARTPRFDTASGLMAANLVFAPPPDYPAFARLAHIQGEVVLQAVVSRDGSVTATRVLSGNRLLRGAATAAVRRWRYRPYVANGRPIDVATIVTIVFHQNR